MFQYLAITFAITWISEAIVILIERLHLLPPVATKAVAMVMIAVFAALAPGFSVYVLLKKHERITGIRDYLNRVFYQKSWKSMLIGTGVAYLLFGAYVVMTETRITERPLIIAPLMILMMIPGGGWEELGWRGFLQPALEEKFGYLLGTLMMGIIWTIWHLPLWLIQNATQKDFKVWAFGFYCITFSYLLATAYKMTKSVFAAILLHAWGNTMCGGLYNYGIMVNGPSRKAVIILLAMVVISTIIYYGVERLIDSKSTVQSAKR